MTKEEIISKLSNKQLKYRFLDNQIDHLRFFWSFAKWNNSKNSDLDLLYHRNQNLSDRSEIFGFLWLMSDIKSDLWIDIDFVNIDFLDDLIKDDVLSTKIQIW